MGPFVGDPTDGVFFFGSLVRDRTALSERGVPHRNTHPHKGSVSRVSEGDRGPSRVCDGTGESDVGPGRGVGGCKDVPGALRPCLSRKSYARTTTLLNSGF